VNHVPPRDRDIAMVFQSYALYPHLTVRQNMAFGLRLRKIDKQEVDRRVENAARILGLDQLLDKKPRALSGGQRQRVAMGRAIVREPQAFLMDEPLSNLDAKLRVQVRAEISALQRNLGVTTVYVTHDQVEAMTMGDRVAVMRKGELQQVAGPDELYERPRNVFVGGFIGSPAMNLLDARLESSNSGHVAVLGEQRIALDSELLSNRPALRSFEGRDVILGIRPEALEDAEVATDAPADRRLKGKVELRESLGSEIVAHVGIDAHQAETEDVRELAGALGTEPGGGAQLATEAEEAVITARFDPRSTASEGSPVEMVVDTRGLHFFDPETSLGIYDDDGG
jgi:multiple sugar transport system ATP-binding protein